MGRRSPGVEAPAMADSGSTRRGARPGPSNALPRRSVHRPHWRAVMTALLRAELLKLRTTRTFAAVLASAAALSLTLVVLGAALGKETKPHALFTNSAITYIIVK